MNPHTQVGRRLRVLFVSPVSPIPPTYGAAQRTYLLLQALKQVGDVDLYLLNNADRLPANLREELVSEFGLVGPKPNVSRVDTPAPSRGGSSPGISKRLTRYLMRPMSNSRLDTELAGRVDRVLRANHYDAVIARYLATARRAGLIGRGDLIVDVDDFGSERYRSRARAPGLTRWQRVALLSQAARISRLETGLLEQVPMVWTTKEEDNNRTGSAPSVTIRNIPLGAHTGTLRLLPEKPRSMIVLVVAAFGYSPNARGMSRFLERVWPLVRSRVPSGRLRVVGAGVDPTAKAHWETVPGVEVVGFVDDLVDEYSRAAVAVAPVYDGGGTHVKVVEALGMGRVCVTSEHGARGYMQLVGQLPALHVAANDDEFADAIVDLLSNSQQRAEMTAVTAGQVAAIFSFESMKEAVARSVASLLATSGSSSGEGPKTIGS